MIINARFATIDDFDWCAELDNHIPNETILRRKIAAEEILLAEANGQRVGYLRLEYLWSMVPYIALIRVRDDHRKRGIGRAMLAYLEAYLRERGYNVLMSSSQLDEPEPQAWHRRVGFEECGIINGLNEGGIGEVFFRKKL